MKIFVVLFVVLAVCRAEDEPKKTEKRGVVGLGYGGYGGYAAPYAGLPVAHGYGAYPGYSSYHGYSGYPGHLGYSHGLGLPYAGLPVAHGYAAPALHAPLIAKTVAPVSYAAPLHAPLISKAIAPVSPFGYSSPYFGLGHGLYH